MVKKLSLLILTFILTFIGMNSLNAASASISAYSNRSQVVVGNTFTVTVTVSSSEPLGSWQYSINYDSSKVKLVSGDQKIVDFVDNSNTKSRSYTYTFKALKSGSATIGVKAASVALYNDDTKEFSPSTRSTTVTMITQEQLEASYSKDNTLKLITVNDYTLSPKFDKDTLEYTVEVPSTVEKIELNATTNDSAATVNGTGTKEVSEGDNLFELLVTAENGSTKTYKVNVKVEDPNPIIVTTTNNLTGTIVKRASSLTKPNTFTETEIEINGEKIPAFKSELTNFVLVGLKIENENIGLYIYNEEANTYTPYNELSFESILLFQTEYDNYPEGYTKTEIEINGIKTYAYKKEGTTDFYLIYGTNIETGESHLYEYNIHENTLSRYNDARDKEINTLNKKIQNYTFIILVLGVESVILLIILICVLISKNKTKKVYKKFLREYEEKRHKKHEKIKEKQLENKTHEKESTQNITEDKIENTKEDENKENTTDDNKTDDNKEEEPQKEDDKNTSPVIEKIEIKDLKKKNKRHKRKKNK